MAQSVATDRLSKAHLSCSLSDGSLQDRLMQVVSPLLSGAWVNTDLRGWEHPLPPPLSIRIRILSLQGVRQQDSTEAALQVALVQGADAP